MSSVLKNSSLLLLLIAAISSCKKNKEDYGNPAVLQAYNVMDDGIELRTNFSGTHPIRYSSAKILLNKIIYFENNVFINKYPQVMALYAIPDTLDKDLPVVNMVLEFNPGDMYSLFVYGTKADAGYVLNKEDFTAGDPKDSLTFVRIVNLCPDQNITVNLKNEPQRPMAENIAFKQITDFSGIKADKSVSELEFEIRDQVSGDLIITYTATAVNAYDGRNFWLNKNNTLIFTGRRNGTGLNAPKIVLAHHAL